MASAEVIVGNYVADVPFQVSPQQVPLGSCSLFNTTTVLDTTAPAANPAFAAITGTQTGRLVRNGVPATCAAPKTNPGLNDTSVVRRFDRYRYTPSVNSCVTVALTQPSTTLFVYAVSSFDPASPSSGYLADPGASAASTTFSLNVTAGVPIDIVVHEVNANGGIGATYSLDVSSDAPCGGVDADLAVVLTDGPDPVAAGTNISYTATLTNTGPGDATNAAVSLPVPAGTTFVSASADNGGTCTNVSPITCTWAGNTANGAVRIATIMVAVPTNAAAGSLINAGVTATSDTPDADPADNTSTAGTGVITVADLSVALTDTPDPATAGGGLSYTTTLTNNGPSDAQNAALTLNLPPEVTQGTVTPSAGGNCAGTGTITCTWAGATAPAGTRNVTVATTVAANVLQGSVLSASATGSSATTDPAAGNNAANTTTTINASADLLITLSDAPDPVVAGTQLTYTATLTNAGPSDAQDATITLPLPAGTSFVSAVPSAGGSCNAASPVVCTWSGATTTADTRTATIVPLVSPSQTANLSAAATASSPTSDPAAGNNTATATTVVQVQADLSITLTDAPDPVVAGTELTYTATLTNAGPSDATAVVVNLPAPAGTSFVAGSVSGGGSCAAGISCSISGSMAPGSSRTVTITVLVAASVLDGTLISATAAVTAGSPDPNGANNSASTTTAVIAQADLAINLTASAPQVLINVPLTFTATSTNNGPSDAQNVSITLTLTPDFRYSSHVATGATCTTPQIGTTGAIVCTWAGATAPGTVRTLTVVAYSNNEGNTAVNASTTSSTTDPVANNNAGALSVVVGFPFNEIPTLSQLGLLLLGVLVGLLGFATARRQG